jgi:hypothetical protein
VLKLPAGGVDHLGMDASAYAFVHGMPSTRGTLAAWNKRPWPVLAAWLAGSLAAAAAWIIASRRGDWDELLAATVVTVALAVPVLVVTALWEVSVAPHLLGALIGY